MGLAENVIQWLLSSLNICVWMWEESVCLCVFVHVDLCMCIRQLFLRPVAREAASARSNLLAWRCRIWYFLRLWPNITRSLIQHSSLIPSIPCIPFLHSLHCHHLTAAPSLLPALDISSPPHPTLCSVSPSPSNSWAQLAADRHFCFVWLWLDAVTGWQGTQASSSDQRTFWHKQSAHFQSHVLLERLNCYYCAVCTGNVSFHSGKFRGWLHSTVETGFISKTCLAKTLAGHTCAELKDRLLSPLGLLLSLKLANIWEQEWWYSTVIMEQILLPSSKLLYWSYWALTAQFYKTTYISELIHSSMKHFYQTTSLPATSYPSCVSGQLLCVVDSGFQPW